MVARGDLGVEVPAARVPHIQKTIIRKCNDNYKPVITATQMLDSMTHNPRPTRAEVTDVANAIYDGTDCVMLSGETAAGLWPVEAVKTMSDICKETERYLDERHEYHERGGLKNVNSSIGYAAVTTAEHVGAQCILCPTHSGRTARLIATFKPRQPFWATSPSEVAIRRTCFNWGCYAFLSQEQPSLMPTIHNAIEVVKKNGVVNLHVKVTDDEDEIILAQLFEAMVEEAIGADYIDVVLALVCEATPSPKPSSVHCLTTACRKPATP